MTVPIRFALTFLFFVTFLTNSVARADWINLTGAETSPNIAEIYILDDHVKLALEVYIGDLTTFHHLVPDDWLKDPDINRPTTAERMRQFSSDMFQFVTDKGEKLTAPLIFVGKRMSTTSLQ